jgi:poly(3-hydroxybutyrate) depolymerase
MSIKARISSLPWSGSSRSWSPFVASGLLGLALLAGCASGADNDGTGGASGSAGGAGGNVAPGHGGSTVQEGRGGVGQGGSGQAGAPSGNGGSAAGAGGGSGNAGASGSGPGRGGTTGAAGAAGSPGGSGGHAAGSGGDAGGATGAAGRGGGGPTGGAGRGGSGGSSTGTGGSGTPGMSSGCGKAPGIASSMYNNGKPISIMAANMQRRYLLNVPTNYDNTKPYKLVVAYHALNSNDQSVYSEKYYGLLPLSNNSTIFVAPNGQKNGAPCSGNSAGDSGCGWPNTQDQDMQLADAVVKQVEDNFCVDTNRIFATGWSYGASMSQQTACERPLGGTAAWGVRAIAIYAVAYLSNSVNCKVSKPVAYYATHGTHDSVLQYSGGVSIAQTWATADGCTWKTPQMVSSGAHVCTKLDGCMAGYPLEFCSFNGDHTAYPDNGQQNGSWGPQEAWTFLNQF